MKIGINSYNFTDAQKREITIVTIVSAKNVIETETDSEIEWREKTSPQL